MIRVVLDTNILVSALLQPQGLPARTFLMALAGTTAQLCVSGDIYAEYEEVIRRSKFNRSEAVIESALHAIWQNGLWVKRSEKVHACSDPDDDIFLECAQAARAHYLVTGNQKHFPAKWADTQIVTARQFLDAVAESQDEPKIVLEGAVITENLARTQSPSAGVADRGNFEATKQGVLNRNAASAKRSSQPG